MSNIHTLKRDAAIAAAKLHPQGNPPKNTVRFFLCRHAETSYNASGQIQGGAIDSDLSVPRGVSQAIYLAHRLAGVQFDVVGSSPLRRARQTCALVVRGFDGGQVESGDEGEMVLPEISELKGVELHEGLVEMNYGVLEGKALADVGPTVHELLSKWEAGEVDHCVEAGESPQQVSKRSRKVLDSIGMREDIQNVLLVCHGRLLRALLCSLLDEYGLHRMQLLDQHNTCVNILEFDRTEKKYKAVLLNCTAHLHDDDINRSSSLVPSDLTGDDNDPSTKT